MEAFLDATKVDLLAAHEEARASEAGREEEKADAKRGWAAAREAEDGLQRSNTRAEEAYGKVQLAAVLEHSDYRGIYVIRTTPPLAV